MSRRLPYTVKGAKIRALRYRKKHWLQPDLGRAWHKPGGCRVQRKPRHVDVVGK